MNFAESLALKAVSLLLALILWVTILSLKPEERKIEVGLEPMLPLSMVLLRPLPSTLQFTLQGSRIVLNDYERKLQDSERQKQPGDPQKFPVIRMDLTRARETSFEYQTKDLLGELPKGVKLTSFYPPTISVRLEDVMEKWIPVKPLLKGEPAEGLEIGAIQVTPTKVKVSGARSLIEGLVAVETKPFNVEELRGTIEETLEVEVDRTQGFQLTGERLVKVRVTTRRAAGK